MSTGNSLRVLRWILASVVIACSPDPVSLEIRRAVPIGDADRPLAELQRQEGCSDCDLVHWPDLGGVSRAFLVERAALTTLSSAEIDEAKVVPIAPGGGGEDGYEVVLGLEPAAAERLREANLHMSALFCFVGTALAGKCDRAPVGATFALAVFGSRDEAERARDLLVPSGEFRASEPGR